MIGKVLRRYPYAEQVFRRHFGEKFLERGNIRILSLGLACILRGVSLANLMEELQEFPRQKGEIYP